jgi:hypothetical protein
MFVINPGSGPVRDSNEERAEANARAFVEDLGISGVSIQREPRSDEKGRFGFVLTLNDMRVEMEMPGIPLENVRYLGIPGQNIWDFPRLFVDGSSWVWKFAIAVTVERFTGRDECEADCT